MDVKIFILFFIITFIASSSGLPSKPKTEEESSSPQIIDINGELIYEERSEYEEPATTTTARPKMTAEEIRNFKFVFPKGHFINELLHYNHF